MEKRKNYQVRNFRSLDLNANDEAAEKIISGYFIVFNSETELYEGCFEEIAPESFDNVDLSDVRALIDHETSKVLGRTKSGTLTLSVDAKGVYGEIKVNENDTEAMNLYSRVQRGDVDQCSFGFNILDEAMETRDDGSYKFTIKAIELFEVSVVTFPAYADTAVEARSKQIENMEKRELLAKKSKLEEKLNGLKTTYFE
ncbi:HK97 family phage prohead protease [Lactococcus lactis subsp. lactis]|jgi:HK97 family phage prohead protease|uniref:HK97 family phage prohead protease n=1 Tax=Lactococcus lactis TaxID=1358 RepID=UPI001BA610BD|nr:HK97 family phage prohead protease [Lactococcus lactis]MBR8674074.1 HK97 family phage prohead protease [Lactococcus lactis subsp. lactis]MBR8676967.1 HK97 family phage prohead protease [Lactococcus lactis subsp. lactis]MBR8684246.1 HK97 family phage prohead protease [Lactococcus lactis subsp. lactis]MCI2095927.1 HK97 family phage prohead protease [Lactococcus lactis]MCI2139091.1 HK97 family phage prohead protease [Lactococcus lactis]